MGRRPSSSQLSNSTGTSIKWSGHLSRMLALKVKAQYKSKYLLGNKIQVAKQWAVDLGISHNDEKGDRTKAQVHQLLKKYKDAKDLQMKTGSGDTTRTTIVNGKEVETIWTLKQQILEICPLYEILDSFLGDAYKDPVNTKDVGASELGFHGPLKINGKFYQQQNSQKEEDNWPIDPALANILDDASFDEASPDEAGLDIQSTIRVQPLIQVVRSPSPVAQPLTPAKTPQPRKRLFESSRKPAVVVEEEEKDMSFTDDEEKEDSDSEEEEPSRKRGKVDIAMTIRKEISGRAEKEAAGSKSRLTRAQQQQEQYANAVEICRKRMEIAELKYRARAGDKGKDQREHEIRLAEIQLKREKELMNIEKIKLEQLKLRAELMRSSAVQGKSYEADEEDEFGM